MSFPKKPFAQSYVRRRDPVGDTQFRRPRAASQAYAPGALPAAYNWPTGVKVKPLTIVICELGGKFYPADVAAWAAKGGFPVPTVTTHLLPGADDSSSDADAEVALDWQRAAEAWSFMTGTAANIVLIYGPNSGTAFSDCMNYANSLPGVGAGSWSWGSQENTWLAADRAALDASAQQSPYPWCAAAGDNDSGDGARNPTADYPSSSLYIVGCGGTSKAPGGPEVVWNNGDNEGTGGGFSKIYARPAYQAKNAQSPAGFDGFMRPDLAAVGDPNTGYDTLINGSWQVIGGTSAVAPLMAGFFAVVNGVRLFAGLPMLGLVNQTLWSLPSCFLDITSGNNGAYSATTGADPCSGLGRPLPTLLSAMTGSAAPPPPPPTPTATIQQQIDALFAAFEARLAHLPRILAAVKALQAKIDALFLANPAMVSGAGFSQRSISSTISILLADAIAAAAAAEPQYAVEINAVGAALVALLPLLDGSLATHAGHPQPRPPVGQPQPPQPINWPVRLEHNLAEVYAKMKSHGATAAVITQALPAAHTAALNAVFAGALIEAHVAAAHTLTFGQILQLVGKYGPIVYSVLQDLVSGSSYATLIGKYGPVVVQILESILGGTATTPAAPSARTWTATEHDDCYRLTSADDCCGITIPKA